MNFEKIEERIKALPPLLILSLLLFVTLLVSFFSQQTIKSRHQERLKQLSNSISNLVLTRIERYERSLVHVHAYFMTHPDVTREQFKTYVELLDLETNYPGLQGLGFTKRVLAEEVENYETSLRKEGFPDFKLWPQGGKDEYFSIHFLEPFDWRNQRAFGFDMFSQPLRRQAMIQARDTGKSTLSSLVTLVQETSKKVQPGFLIYLPLYKYKTIPDTIEERRKTLLGFIYAPFRAHDFLNEVFSHEFKTNDEVNVQIYDGEDTSPDKIIYDNNLLYKNFELSPNSDFSIKNIIKPNNHPWTIVTTYRSTFNLNSELFVPWIVFIIGVILSLLITWIFYASRKHAIDMETSLTRFNALVSNLTEGLIFAHPNGDIQFMNKVALEIYQFNNADEIVTKRDEYNKLFTFKNLKGEEIPFAERPINRTINGQKYSDYELEYCHYGCEETKYVSYGGTPIYDKKGKVVLVVVTVKDITEKKKIELELRKAISARDEFVSISSHELKTPLTSLKLKTQFFLRKLNQNKEISLEEIYKFSDGLEQQISRLTRLVDDMLDISRLRSGKFNLSKQKTNFCQLVSEVLERIKPQFIEAGYQEPVLKNLNEAYGFWDPLRIEQVISNLLTNAIRYGEGKPVFLEVKIIGNNVQLSVQDHGAGISEEQKERIFNRFERLTEVHESTGLGLGLFLSQRIIIAHQGRIWVESEINKGSTFYFSLPLNNSETEGPSEQA